jgi:ABC-type branched-subunit amino acid transport system ATPase component
MAVHFLRTVTFTVNKGDKIALLSRDPLAVTSFFNIITGETIPTVVLIHGDRLSHMLTYHRRTVNTLKKK